MSNLPTYLKKEIKATNKIIMDKTISKFIFEGLPNERRGERAKT
jgi:uncharacterized protein YehS (DUF1456 family)